MNYYVFTLETDGTKTLYKDFNNPSPNGNSGAGLIITDVERTLSYIGKSADPGVSSFLNGIIKGFNVYKKILNETERMEAACG